MSTQKIADYRGGWLAHLDLARGVAALVVLAEHLRNFQFVQFSKLAAPPNLFDKFFYVVTGLGHQAVMIFFVLSGYFVGGSVLRDCRANQWSWARFASRRLTRLYLVLIPALLLTLLWDSLGEHHAPLSNGYSGSLWSLYCSGPTLHEPAQDGLAAFFGNSFFLQAIATPVYGSNGPLWSLAYEFWYYLMFPLAMLALFSKKSWLYRGTHALLLAVCLAALPREVLTGGVIWLMGCGIAFVSGNPALNKHLSGKGTFFFWAAIFLVVLVISRQSTFPGLNHLLGLSFALALPFLIRAQPVSRIYASVATGLSDISYTLYLTHFPVLAFFFFSFGPDLQVNPSLGSYAQFALFFGAILAYATALWWLFERRTDAVRKALERNLRMN